LAPVLGYLGFCPVLTGFCLRSLWHITPGQRVLVLYMHGRSIIGLLVLLTVVLPAHAQGIGEFSGVHAGAAGLGAGLAASQNHGALVRNGYEAAGQLQQAVYYQNRAIQQYLAVGQTYEAKKQWKFAEQAFTYVLQVIAKRDGPGSPAAVPALKHLVAVSKGQNKPDQAIGYQKTIVAFAHAAPKRDTDNLLKEEQALSDMYIQKGDFTNAEPVLQDAVKIQETAPKMTPERRSATLKVYGRVLRELKKLDEADAVDALVLNLRQPVPGTPASLEAVVKAGQPDRAAVETAPAAATAVTKPAGTAVNSTPTDLEPAPAAPATAATTTAAPSSSAANTTSLTPAAVPISVTTTAPAPVPVTATTTAPSSTPVPPAAAAPASTPVSPAADAPASQPVTAPAPALTNAETASPVTATTTPPVTAPSSAPVIENKGEAETAPAAGDAGSAKPPAEPLKTGSSSRSESNGQSTVPDQKAN
jgi:hypothetical protein